MDVKGTVGPPPPSEPPAQPAQLLQSRGKRRMLVLKVDGRMLWVGSAALPLHNITWVDAFRSGPRWGTTFVRFLKWEAAAIVLVYAAAYVANGGSTGERGPGPLPVLVPLLVFVLKLFEQSKPVLAVETAGGSAVLVTLPSMDELRRIAGQIVHAIDHPDAEFTAVVQQLNSNNTNNYGPVVHMQGGRGNTGFKL
ncbi:DUF6232 family protein [Streptomyces sp. NPDC093225]|uniref:DUF6232 family protein n=1 Tax=Streptomyces sp. NPDC093225 TaxID=3366034 RepID=UPI00380002FD